MSIYELIDSVEYVSFDIFDTLIKRNVRKPVDVFDLVELKYNKVYGENISNFKINRRIAEKKARKTSKYEEIDIHEIYKNLEAKYTKEQCKRLKAIEVEKEILVCQKNPQVFEIYEYAKSKGKKIIIVSDMYLYREVIEEILKSNDMGEYDRLFISSEQRRTKYKGTLYKHILKELGCKPEQILHMGDNEKSDVIQASNNGLKSYKIELKEVDLKFNKYLPLTKEDKNCINKVNAFIQNNQATGKSEDYYIGYKNLGILFYGYLQWINNYAKIKGMDKLVFFARDGHILKRAYDEFFDEDQKIKTEYMYISRRAVIVPSFKESITYDELVSLLGLRKKDTIKSFFSRIGLDYKNYTKEIEASGYNVEAKLNLPKDSSKLNVLFDSIKTDMIDNATKEKKLFRNYINQIGIENKSIGIIDIGWRGSMQYSLINILNYMNIDTKIYGMYLGINRDSKKFFEKGMEADGYLFANDRNENVEFITSAFIGLLETLFLAPHGSTIGYKLSEDCKNIEPILDKIEYKGKDLEMVLDIQKGALDFIKDFSKCNKGLKIKVNENIALNNLCNIAITPDTYDLVKFGDISFSDFDESYLAKPEGLSKYISSPKSLISEFFSSQWKVGFLKRLFKIDMPYFKIYKLMKKAHEGGK